ncbi:MAG: DNA topoisomerase I [Candidatus Thermoplasmatota archaeon]|nr:DNA topoisomerase I [Candidatus Thermoplasmatota archaeon]MCL5785550.1 DNA topoisomerase I [Candidatus Thermoplasmatota archaeon]
MSTDRVLRTTLIITEKADAGRRISYFLSDGKAKASRAGGLNFLSFEKDGSKNVVVPLSGHIVELDFPKDYSNWSGTPLENLLTAETVKNVKNSRAFNTLVNFGKDAERIIVATDYDREGELIGVEALEIIGNGSVSDTLNEKVLRAKFSTLTGDEIRKSFDDLISVDHNLAGSARAREEIDLVWGAVLTRFFSLATKRLGKNFISIGRVQTPTLALIVKREKEIRNFVPETFWKISATFHKSFDFHGEHENNPVFDRKQAQKLFDSSNVKTGTVKEFEKHDEKIYRPPPFNTTEFLRDASRMGIRPGRAMSVAESLYVRGFISYPRTDNTTYPRSISLKSVLNKLSKGEFGSIADEILSFEKIWPSRGKTETTDHPPIYPVSVPAKGSLKGEYARVYELIARRFFATLHREGTKEVKSALIDVGGNSFKCSGTLVLEKGWLEVYPYRTVREEKIPDLEPGEIVQVKAVEMNEDQTKPPPRYDLSGLLKKMEDLRLGTKSTRHDIIDKLQVRGFIEGNPVRPTPLGIGLVDALLTVDSKISEPDMTARLEEDMDRVAASQLTVEKVVGESKEMLRVVLSDLKKNESEIRDRVKKSIVGGEPFGSCPLDGGLLSLARDRELYKVSCTTEGCRTNTIFRAVGLIQNTGEACNVCGLPKIKIIRRGQSPETRCLDRECESNRKRDIVGACPSDGGNLVVRQSRYGKRFLGCSNYPKCTVTYPLPQMGMISPSGEKCDHCGAPTIYAIRGKRRWKFCPKMDCEFNKKKTKVKKKTGKASRNAKAT